MEQIRFSFDRITLMKIAKGILIAATGPAALGALAFLQTDVVFENPYLMTLITAGVPMLTQTVRQWMKGKKR